MGAALGCGPFNWSSRYLESFLNSQITEIGTGVLLSTPLEGKQAISSFFIQSFVCSVSLN